MEKIYVVHWASASSDDDGNAKAYAGIHGVYHNLPFAQLGLTECKNILFDEAVQSPDDEELADNVAHTHVYGSVEEGHFEIDYFIGDIPCEVYITITEHYNH